MDTPQNETPEAVTSLLQTFIGYLSAYGWHLLFLVVTLNLAYTQFRPKIQKWLDQRSDQQRETEYQQNPDQLIAMQESLVRSRQRMQEEINARASEQAEKLKQREEEKRQEKIKQWECKQTGSSYAEANKFAEASAKAKKKEKEDSGASLRNQNYNPLMGFSSGSSYRPSRRGGSAGG